MANFKSFRLIEKPGFVSKIVYQVYSIINLSGLSLIKRLFCHNLIKSCEVREKPYNLIGYITNYLTLFVSRERDLTLVLFL